jgi:hypothetical protein
MCVLPQIKQGPWGLLIVKWPLGHSFFFNASRLMAFERGAKMIFSGRSHSRGVVSGPDDMNML